MEQGLAAMAGLHGQCWAEEGTKDSSGSGGGGSSGCPELARKHFARPGCFWTAEKNNKVPPGQLKEAWAGVLHRFEAQPFGPEHDGSLFASIGETLDKVHAVVSARLSTSSPIGAQTLLHGDFKLANLLWPATPPATATATAPTTATATATSTAELPLLLDWEWAGKIVGG